MGGSCVLPRYERTSAGTSAALARAAVAVAVCEHAHRRWRAARTTPQPLLLLLLTRSHGRDWRCEGGWAAAPVSHPSSA